MQWEAHQQVKVNMIHDEPGVIDVYLSRNDLHTYVILAERFDNPSFSVTNAFENYATAVCARFRVIPKRAILMELYVNPVFHQQKVHLEYNLTRCDLPLQSSKNTSPVCHPIEPLLKQNILASLIRDTDLNVSYDTPKHVSIVRSFPSNSDITIIH